MDFKKITKVAIFIDYENFTIEYGRSYGAEVDDNLWNKISDELLNYYRDNFVKNDFEVVEHTGTKLCVGISDEPWGPEKERKEIYRRLDKKPGFIVNYGFRKPAYKHPRTNEYKFGDEKGVDAEIICQMLMGAFLNHYDACILLSDDMDYIPVVRRVQEYFGKKVIQAGFKETKLTEQAYAHILFGKHGEVMNLEKLAMQIGGDILFESEKATLDTVETAKLAFILEKLKDSEISITIHGHTDNTGTEEDNLKLSKARAEAVEKYLIEKGIPPERVSHKGHGHTKPVAPNTTEEGRRKNRRVEFEMNRNPKHHHESSSIS